MTAAGKHFDEAQPRSDRGGFWNCLRVGLWYYVLTSLVVLLGVVVAYQFRSRPGYPMPPADFVSCFANWDGEFYTDITRDGYSYLPVRKSVVAFFPAYPLLARCLEFLSGVRPVVALAIVAHVCLAAAFIALGWYTRLRFPDASPSLQASVLLAFGVLPTTFFLRMAYSEALFVLMAILVLLAIERRRPAWLIALAVGFATAVRPAGPALLLPFLLYLWRSSPDGRTMALRLVGTLPVACWGLAAYLAYLGVAFGDPLAVVHAQMQWQVRDPGPVGSRLLHLALLEPLWTVYDPASPGYWRTWDPYSVPWLCLYASNPIYFVLTAVLIGVGAWKRWLTAYEVLLSAGLLFIPYVTRGYEMCMTSGGRFAAVAFPVYLVLGQFLVRLPRWLAVGLLIGSAGLLGLYAAKFVIGYPFFC